MRSSINDVKGVLAKVVDALDRLTRLEERHASAAASLDRAFTTIARMEARLSAVEQRMPVHGLAVSWALRGVWAAAGALAIFMLKKLGVM